MFDESARARMAAAEFGIDPASDRTGVRLRGVALDAGAFTLEKSEGVVPGAVQVPPSGEPIVLGVDGPTVGGYPVIASVIGADLPALAQLAAGARVRFAWTDLKNAHAALRELEALIERVAMPDRSGHYDEGRDPGASR
jgi:allophanate hydrolase subunit 2